jgi:hypothetical protein
MSQKDFVVWNICLETRIQASKAVKSIGSKVVKLGGYALSNGGVRRDHERVLTETEQETLERGEGCKAKIKIGRGTRYKILT